MSFAETMWLNTTAAQRNAQQLMSYQAAFYGTAALQGWKLGIEAPIAFWKAMSRVGGSPAQGFRSRVKLEVVAEPLAPAAKPAPPKAPAAKAAPVKTAEATTKTKPPQPAEKPKAAAAKVSAPSPEPTPSVPKPTASKAAAPKAKAQKAPEPTKTIQVNPQLLDAPRGGKADDLTTLSGVGTKLAATLNEFGIYHIDQIATLDERGIAWLNEQQPGFKALAKRFDLVNQARGIVH